MYDNYLNNIKGVSKPRFIKERMLIISRLLFVAATLLGYTYVFKQMHLNKTNY